MGVVLAASLILTTGLTCFSAAIATPEARPPEITVAITHMRKRGTMGRFMMDFSIRDSMER
jgi:hypothetical protein